MDTGTCVGCGAEDELLNEDGYCGQCADLEGDDMNKDDDLDSEGFEEDDGA
jgi:hypothetical protein